jgi:DNA-directed RNA polymerase alpha subunit
MDPARLEAVAEQLEHLAKLVRDMAGRKPGAPAKRIYQPDLPISVLQLTGSVEDGLRAQGIVTLGHLVQQTPRYIKSRVKGVGQVQLDKIRLALFDFGIFLCGDVVEAWSQRALWILENR